MHYINPHFTYLLTYLPASAGVKVDKSPLPDSM